VRAVSHRFDEIYVRFGSETLLSVRTFSRIGMEVAGLVEHFDIASGTVTSGVAVDGTVSR
jgi:hypothetical protein